MYNICGRITASKAGITQLKTGDYLHCVYLTVEVETDGYATGFEAEGESSKQSRFFKVELVAEDCGLMQVWSSFERNATKIDDKGKPLNAFVGRYVECNLGSVQHICNGPWDYYLYRIAPMNSGACIHLLPEGADCKPHFNEENIASGRKGNTSRAKRRSID